MNFSETFDKAKNWALGIRNEEEAVNGLTRDSKWKQALGSWRKRTFKLAVGVTAVGLLIRSGPILLYAALPAWGLYGAVRLAEYAVDRDIRMKFDAAERMKADKEKTASAKPAYESAPKLAKNVTSGFNAKVSPAVSPEAIAAQAPKSVWSRLGLG